jgi:hypothetical protein
MSNNNTTEQLARQWAMQNKQHARAIALMMAMIWHDTSDKSKTIRK